ncbi:MAG: sensor histidine kinase [Corynebacterium humireducens]|uniref:Sensor histidine kinase n=1 Tax=Corynebacterium humireducens TaxID=1223514 RepID=A0A7X6PM97_9CORY|nr:sensor histidine kinase [Corynebacterium humireducens]
MITLLRSLRVGLHVLFAFLLGLGVALFLWEDPARAATTPVLPLTVTLALVYVVGTVWEHSVSTPPRAVVWWWLAVVTLLWHALVAVSITFVWLLFPLVLLFLHLLPRTLGVVAATVLWGIAAFVPAKLHPGEWTAGSAVGPLIGTVLAVAIYWTYVALHREAAHHRAVADDLRATQEELAASEHQAGRLEERERLSREIHDTVAQGLSSIVLVSRAVRGSLERGDLEAALRQVRTIEDQASDSLGEARRFVRDLAAPGEPVPVAVRHLIHRTLARQEALGEPLSIELQLSGDTDRELPEPVARAVTRAAGELLANVVKHAGATRAVVTYAVWDTEVTLDVIDDGRGFSGAHGYGLRGLESRVAAVGGELLIESDSDGTAAAVHIPLTSEKEPS